MFRLKDSHRGTTEEAPNAAVNRRAEFLINKKHADCASGSTACYARCRYTARLLWILADAFEGRNFLHLGLVPDLRPIFFSDILIDFNHR